HLVEVEKYDKAAKLKAREEAAAERARQEAIAYHQNLDSAPTGPVDEEEEDIPGSFDAAKLEEATDEQAEKMMAQAQKTMEALAGYIPSLPPPPPPTIEFEEYFNPADPSYLHLGRPLKLHESTHKFNATVWMAAPSSPGVEELPPLDAILPLLDVLGYGSNDHMSRLKSYLEADGMPAGFPVKIEIPLFGLLSASVTFHDFQSTRPIDSLMFAVNPSYKEGVIVQSLADQNNTAASSEEKMAP
ncbi:hypothetical protein HDU93_001732, partial [Gonapodya sp. JEL0774]